MKSCIKCGLPESYQGIRLDEEGVCNFCHFYEEHKERLTDYEELEKQFAAEVEKAKEKARENGSRYDCIVGLSGGKDGAYIAWMMKHKYQMRVLTYTLDNGFSTDFGKQNIEILRDKLDMEHIWVHVKDSQLRKLYSASIKLLKNFCSVCFHLCHYYGFLLADQYGIPLIVNGRTRSQILQSADAQKGIEPFEISRNLQDFEYQMFKRLVEKLAKSGKVDYLPKAEVAALSYFMYHKVSDEEKMEFLAKNVNWVKPKSSVPHPDCWAHAMAENCSMKKHGYPVRTGELACLVREQEISLAEAVAEREEDVAKYAQVDPEMEQRFFERIQKRQ